MLTSTGTDDKYSDWGRVEAKPFYAVRSAHFGRVKAVAQSYEGVSQEHDTWDSKYLPLRDFMPSVVRRPPLRMLYGERS